MLDIRNLETAIVFYVACTLSVRPDRASSLVESILYAFSGSK